MPGMRVPGITSGRSSPRRASSDGSSATAPSPKTMRRAIVSWTMLLLLAPGSQEARRRLVRGEERLDRELGHRDLDGGAEARDGADEGELLALRPQPQRHRDLARLGSTPWPGSAPGRAASSSCSANSAGSPLTTAWRASRSSRCARHSPRLRMRGASPSGWRLSAQDVDRRLQQVPAHARRSASRQACWRRRAPSADPRRRPDTARGRGGAVRARPAPVPSQGRRGRAAAKAGA